jgi:hypothetical protein
MCFSLQNARIIFCRVNVFMQTYKKNMSLQIFLQMKLNKNISACSSVSQQLGVSFHITFLCVAIMRLAKVSCHGNIQNTDHFSQIYVKEF